MAATLTTATAAPVRARARNQEQTKGARVGPVAPVDLDGSLTRGAAAAMLQWPSGFRNSAAPSPAARQSTAHFEEDGGEDPYGGGQLRDIAGRGRQMAQVFTVSSELECRVEDVEGHVLGFPERVEGTSAEKVLDNWLRRELRL
ncbi:hypothetical protein NDU88_003311 [Pleurodeles waltl]|uniref:Uncharacterized protein n=1 Tax=Pleurodeles waltl TaxID=8319 RepID=A0AAV7MDH8_PLEWA|nr:hypothetical protein NDU88_003311 [Pleurodeles waltl]